jgi:hypothetical protein
MLFRIARAALRLVLLAAVGGVVGCKSNWPMHGFF